MTENPTNSLTQYIELFRQNRAMIEAGSIPAMNSRRDAALEVLCHSRLPRRGDEGYARTSPEEMFAPDYGINLSRLDLAVNPAESFKCGVPNLSTRLGIVANDTFHPTSTLEGKLPEGMLFCSLRRAAAEHPDLVERFYATVAPIDNPAVALNTLLAQDGVMIYLPRGLKVEKPLQLVSIFNSTDPLLAFRRLLIVAEEGSELHLLLCDHSAPGAARCMASVVVEAVVAEGATLDLCDIEEASAQTSRLAQTFIRQHGGSRLQLNTVALEGGVTRNEFTVDITGPGCDTLLAGIAVGDGERVIDNSSQVNHLAPRSTSRQLFKYVLDGHSCGAFEGGIRVTGEAPFTEASQTNRNVIASPEATMHSEPQLEIYNDEVKCGHGATTGQLDNEALFYMQTRGIPLREARNMLMQAFMTDVVDTVTMPGLRERLIHLVDCRFNHDPNMRHCADCRS